MWQRAVGRKIEIKRVLGIYFAGETVWKILAQKAELGIVPVAFVCLAQQLFVDIHPHIGIQHVRDNRRCCVIVYARISCIDAHDKIVAVSAAAAHVQDADTFQKFGFSLNQLV